MLTAQLNLDSYIVNNDDVTSDGLKIETTICYTVQHTVNNVSLLV